jgi:hypothetical protein
MHYLVWLLPHNVLLELLHYKSQFVTVNRCDLTAKCHS